MVQVAEEGVVKLKHLQVLGKTKATNGLAIFQAAANLQALSGQQVAPYLCSLTACVPCCLEYAYTSCILATQEAGS